uniref:Dynein axonemal assembly factor 4 n=1 Tax=Sphaeramia orbicularis TaxID=375764 RepID=A0A672ZIV0_9TELE
MPVLVPDYTWTQTQSTVHIHLPLKGAKPGRVHVTSTDEYLKVHFQPFLLEVFLFQPVDDDRSTARIGNGVANITLYKKTNNQWEQLMINTTDKEVMKQIRMKALMKNQEKLTAESKTKTQKRQEERKYTLQSMMKWLRKQAEARRSVNAEVEELKDLKDEERNPDWLKEKGE